MKKLNRAPYFKFVKGQTLFLTELEFYISVRKFIVLEVLKNHSYYYVDPWGEEEDEWTTGSAIRILEDGTERIITLDKFTSNDFISTSARDALKVVKRFSNKTEHYALTTKSFFTTEWT